MLLIFMAGNMKVTSNKEFNMLNNNQVNYQRSSSTDNINYINDSSSSSPNSIPNLTANGNLLYVYRDIVWASDIQPPIKEVQRLQNIRS